MSAAQGVSLRLLCSNLWRDHRLWRRDVDQFTSPQIACVLAWKAGVAPGAVEALRVDRAPGTASRLNGTHPVRWVMPLSMHRTRRPAAGMQFCARCLMADKQPYFRRAWRLAYHAECETHGVPLLDRCPVCGAAVNFYLAALHRRTPDLTPGRVLCRECHHELGLELPGSARPAPDATPALRRLAAGVRRGVFVVPGHGDIDAEAYLRILRSLIHILATGRNGGRLVRMVASRVDLSGLASPEQKPRGSIERWPQHVRRFYLSLATNLLAAGTGELRSLFHQRGIWNSRLLAQLLPLSLGRW